ncbi:MAG TPA: PD-(D/E)XK nuclease family protein [Vicinamibacterales bacterium]|nr:PD-(D/E)XK nuclease family protein [Vicinamibacterales bacterium]
MTTLEDKFAVLQAEWLMVCGHLHRNVADWEQRLDDLAQEEARLRERGQWMHGRADYLGVLGRHRDELMHSRMIGWLLDPCGRHGLGNRVLAGVLEKVFGESRPRPGLAQASIRYELSIGNGRLDVVVTAPELHLVIENKVDASEGDEQCAYYSDNLPSEAQCILLSPDGRASRNSSSFRPLRYSAFADVLRSALADADRNAAGRRIAEDYLTTLGSEFS